MQVSNMRYISSKIIKNQLLRKDKRLIPYLPHMMHFNKNNLNKMLEQYKMVYLKPDHGYKGIGVMRARKMGSKYELRHGVSVNVYTDIESLYRSVQKHIQKKSYLIQKGIWTLKYHNCPIDFRIMIQLNESRKWETSGIMGRVASKNKIVANRSQGGQCLPAETLLKPHMKIAKVKPYINTLFRISRMVGEQFRKKYPKVSQLGVDIAIDHNLKPWILEVNTNPGVGPFLGVDKKMYGRIMQLKRLNSARP